MKEKRSAKEIFLKTASVTAAAAILTGSLVSVSAVSEQTLPSGDTVTRISNPDGKAGETDGLIGDRENGYGWSLAERGEYIYIGGWRNTVGAVVQHYLESALVASGKMDSKTVWALTDIITNSEIPYPENKNSGVLIKMKKSDPGNFEVIAEMEDPFRNVAKYENDLYFTTYVGVSSNDAKIYKLDEDDVLTEVYSTAQGSSMRANCVYRDYLYFAGTHADEKQKDGEPAALAVVRKHDEDDGWDMVADYRDFSYVSNETDSDGNTVEVVGNYGYDSFVSATAGSPFWDMTVFEDEIYATIPNMAGYVVFKGRPAEEGEDANEYGWVWTEVIGRDKNSPNYQGLADNKNGYTDSSSYALGYQSVVGALGVFDGHLYTYDIDHTIAAELMGIQGMLTLVSDPQTADLANYLKPLQTTLNHPQTLWRMDNETGKFEEMTGFTELTKGTSNEYIWKHGVYNGELYISTMDSKVIYNYLTRLTGGSISEMSEEEWNRQIAYISSFVESMIGEATGDKDIKEIIGKVIESAETYKPSEEKIKELEGKLNAELAKLNAFSGEAEKIISESVDPEELKALATFAAAWADSRGLIDENTIAAVAELMAMYAESKELDLTDNEALAAFIGKYSDLPAKIEAVIAKLQTEVQENPEKFALTEEENAKLNAMLGGLSAKLESAFQENFAEEIAEIQSLLDKVGNYANVLDIYMEISEYVKNDVQGFDIFKSADGENWELVTNDGFGDKYNYGALRFLPTEEGMYITTANPFYGTQLYLLTNDKEPETKFEITADSNRADWERGSSEGVSFATNSESSWVTVRKDGKHFGTEVENGFTVKDGVVTLDAELLELLENGENPLTLVLEEGTFDIIVNVTESSTVDEPSKVSDEPSESSLSEESKESSQNSETESSPESSANSASSQPTGESKAESSIETKTVSTVSSVQTVSSSTSTTENSNSNNLSDSSAPDTGDSSPIIALAAAMAISVFGIFRISKNKKEHTEI